MENDLSVRQNIFLCDKSRGHGCGQVGLATGTNKHTNTPKDR
jgi:hypothetical protein